jgi:hypothetical protein
VKYSAWSQELFAPIEVKGLTVDGIRGMRVASLRSFDPAGNSADVAMGLIGTALPQPQRAGSATLGSTTQRGDTKFILAWRSPTETPLLSADRGVFARGGSLKPSFRDTHMSERL